MKIISLFFCTPATCYANFLMARTIRRGFPNAEVLIFDAGSHPDCAKAMADVCREQDLRFLSLGGRIEFVTFLTNYLIGLDTRGSVAVIHSDAAFWESCEHWTFSRLVAGRYIPRWRNEMVGGIQEAQLDPSFLWITDAARFRKLSVETRESRYLFDPFARFNTFDAGEWRFWDCTSTLCAAWPDEIEHFTDVHRRAYDHLHAGTYLDWAVTRSRHGGALRAHHKAVAADPNALRGTWHISDEWFSSRAVTQEVSHA